MSSPRRLAVLTTGRQDFGILRSALVALAEDPSFDLRVWVGGMHLSTAHGATWQDVARAGFPITQRLDFLATASDPLQETADALRLVGAALEEERPWALMLLGDRSETLAAAVAATLARVPVVHLHGGEETEGAIDNACRHALTKLSHLHLVSHAVHAARVLQMGEETESVVVVGAPGLDNRFRSDLPDAGALAERLGRVPLHPLALVTVHPATLSETSATFEAAAVAAALEDWAGTIVVTQPNADAGGAVIREFWTAWAARHPRHVVVDALGEAAFWSLLGVTDVVVGNSSSGIIEAPIAGVPAVNVGDRQRGRLRLGWIRDVPADAEAIREAVQDALAAGRAATPIAGYPEGPAAPRILAALAAWQPATPPRKRFRDA